MNEIKFRAWDKSRDEMYIPHTLHINPVTKSFISIRFNGDFGEDSILMRYAGFKDKNRKEVYEDDIVIAWSAGSKGTFEIKWRQDGAPMWLLYPAWQSGLFWNISATHHTKGKQFIDVSGKIEATNLEGYFDDGIEVIGNIYENPNLKPLRGGGN